jgi:hypothetical protein
VEVFECWFDDPQPIVGQIGSMHRRHIAQNIQSDWWLCSLSCRAVPAGKRKRLE